MVMIAVMQSGQGVADEITPEIIDHGAGASEKDRELIFEPLWRDRGSTPGSGLGLAIVEELVKLHSGTISMKEKPGGGATFRPSFPKANGT